MGYKIIHKAINGESGNTQTSCLIDFEYKAAYFGHFRVISKLLISNPGRELCDK